MSQKLDELFGYLDSLQGRASLPELTAKIADLDLEIDDLEDHVRYSEVGYARNLVRAGEWYHAWVLCWKNGQRSPIHNHAGSSCAVKVLRGIATETIFEFAPNGHVKALFSRDLYEGSVLGSEDTDMHQISNLQAGSADLVTLHIYSPPLLRMETYSLTDLTRGEERWLLEFSDAAGI
jgi:cysteine dioxygenase